MSNFPSQYFVRFSAICPFESGSPSVITYVSGERRTKGVALSHSAREVIAPPYGRRSGAVTLVWQARSIPFPAIM